jgi:hypothetical protein
MLHSGYTQGSSVGSQSASGSTLGSYQLHSEIISRHSGLISRHSERIREHSGLIRFVSGLIRWHKVALRDHRRHSTERIRDHIIDTQRSSVGTHHSSVTIRDHQ